MININSFTIEGKVSEIIKNGFVINTSQYNKNKIGSTSEECSAFTVKTPNQLDLKFIGKLAKVVGRLRHERFSEDGKWHSRIVVIAENILIEE